MKGLEVRGDAAGLAGRIYEDLDFAKRALPEELDFEVRAGEFRPNDKGSSLLCPSPICVPIHSN